MKWETAETYSLALQGLALGLLDSYVLQEVKQHPGLAAWAAIGSFVVAYDMLCPTNHTLSETFDGVVDKHPLLATVGTLAVAGHLLNWWKPEHDPVHKLVELVR